MTETDVEKAAREQAELLARMRDPYSPMRDAVGNWIREQNELANTHRAARDTELIRALQVFEDYKPGRIDKTYVARVRGALAVIRGKQETCPYVQYYINAHSEIELGLQAIEASKVHGQKTKPYFKKAEAFDLDAEASAENRRETTLIFYNKTTYDTVKAAYEKSVGDAGVSRGAFRERLRSINESGEEEKVQILGRLLYDGAQEGISATEFLADILGCCPYAKKVLFLNENGKPVNIWSLLRRGIDSPRGSAYDIKPWAPEVIAALQSKIRVIEAEEPKELGQTRG